MCNTREWDKKSKENIFDFIFEMAFRDATLRNAFVNPYKSKNKRERKTGKESEKQAENDFEELKNNIKEYTKEPIKKYLESILGDKKADLNHCKYQCMLDVFNGVNNFNKQINEKDSKHKGFTFGNIQKLVNMSAKYLYIACYANPEMRTRFVFCDCPMDSIMIKGVVSEAGRNKFERLRKETSWSSLAITDGNNTEIKKIIDLIPKEYVEFQQWIRKNKYEYENVLDFDFRKWPGWSKKFR